MSTQLAEARTPMLEYVSQPNVRASLAKVCTDVLSPEKVVRLSLNVMQANPALQSCSKLSMLGCMMTAAGLGLEPNTPLQHAWIIPYENNKNIGGQWQKVMEAQFMIGYRGFVDLMWRSEHLELLILGAARARDEFDSYVSSDVEGGTFFKFRKRLDGERGDLVAAFCYSQTGGKRGVGKMATVMTAEEVLKRRARSHTYNSLVQRAANAQGSAQARAQRKLDETPWVMWEDEMWTKTAIRTHAGHMPLTTQLMAAVAIDAASDEGRLDMGQLADPEHMQAVKQGETAPPEIDGEYERVDDGAPSLAEEAHAEVTKAKGRGRPKLSKEEKARRAEERKRAKEQAQQQEAAPAEQAPAPQDEAPPPLADAGDDALFQD